MEAERALGEVIYVFKKDHRDESWQKSQWRITHDEEVDCFLTMRQKLWGTPRRGWGLHLVGPRLCQLGIAVDRTRELFFAKFLGEDEERRWHGYPADYMAHAQDVPDSPILRVWLELGHLKRAQVRKILRQQYCRLGT